MEKEKRRDRGAVLSGASRDYREEWIYTLAIESASQQVINRLARSREVLSRQRKSAGAESVRGTGFSLPIDASSNFRVLPQGTITRTAVAPACGFPLPSFRKYAHRPIRASGDSMAHQHMNKGSERDDYSLIKWQDAMLYMGYHGIYQCYNHITDKFEKSQMFWREKLSFYQIHICIYASAISFFLRTRKLLDQQSKEQGFNQTLYISLVHVKETHRCNENWSLQW